MQDVVKYIKWTLSITGWKRKFHKEYLSEKKQNRLISSKHNKVAMYNLRLVAHKCHQLVLVALVNVLQWYWAVHCQWDLKSHNSKIGNRKVTYSASICRLYSPSAPERETTTVTVSWISASVGIQGTEFLPT